MSRFIAILVLLCVSSTAWAAAGAVDLGPADVFETAGSRGDVTCGRVDGEFVSGRLLKNGMFLPTSAKAKNLRRQARRANGTKRSKLLNRAKKLKARQRAGDAVCRSGPGATPTPAPTGNFESNGDVTASGKILFGIPAQLAANVSTGSEVFHGNCVGCHEPRVNRSFSNLRTNTKRPPMFFDESSLPDEQLAHLTAYLNRFRP